MQHAKLISPISTKGNHPGEIVRDDFLGPMKISVCVEELRADPEILRSEPISRTITPPLREGLCSTSCTISNSYFPTIRRWGDPAAFLARASSSSLGRHSLSPIGCREISFRYCASITAPAVGLRAFSGTRRETTSAMLTTMPHNSG